MKNLIGTTLDEHYKFISVIGEGATSTVYLATDLQMGAMWAIKVLDKGNNIQAFHRQKEEAIMLSKFSNPMFPRVLPTIYDQPEALYIVMDYVHGVQLSEFLENNTISVMQAINWLKQICHGIEYLHEQGYAYCDLKPDNIVINNHFLKMIDFGACKKIGDTTNRRAGTAEFSPPEYANRSIPVGTYTDIYAIGKLGQYICGFLEEKEKPSELISFLNLCCQADYEQRPKSAEDVYALFHRIEQKNDPVSGYKVRLAVFLSCIILCIVSFTLGMYGYFSNVQAYRNEFNVLFNQAVKYEQEGDITNATEAYLNASIKDPGRTEVYEKIYQLMLPKKTDENVKEKNKALLDVFRERTEPKYLSESLRSQLSELCIEQDSPIYQEYAKTLLKNMKGEKAEILQSIVNGQGDTNQIIEQLKHLIESTDNTDEKMDSLFLLLNVYSNLGSWNQENIDFVKITLQSMNQDVLNNHVKLIPAYKLIALGLSNNLDDMNSRQEALKWWNKLDSFHAEYTKEENITRGKLFYAEGDYTKAAESFGMAIDKDSNDLLSYLYAIDSLLKSGNNGEAGNLWQKAKALKVKQNESLSANLLYQYNALQLQMQMYGIQ
ncbi:protein kinase family protein [Eubacterium sp. 1001713B170207_170306_E7]|uniref:protein kinase family protein n=1 Tax=Eubacterium sp. 1001713B170207_170306_E7 TaxID=2787097 RepID=UPI00189A6BA7|nr:protein kinase family protein [Eubacterium sp. 1001713B170207_170306_E7]